MRISCWSGYYAGMNMILESIGSWLTWLFPPTEQAVRIEEMGVAEFKKSVSLAKEQNPGITSLFAYKDELVQAAVWELKYHGNIHIGRLLATLLYEKISDKLIEQNIFLQKFLVIPLPLSKERLTERGWNQSEILAREICKLDKNFLLCTNILQKIRHTQPQTKLDRNERLINLKNCFGITNKKLIQHQHIILIDDVTTTGSTINEARQLLQSAGVASIQAFTLAH